jgi:hypothetical protein
MEWQLAVQEKHIVTNRNVQLLHKVLSSLYSVDNMKHRRRPCQPACLISRTTQQTSMKPDIGSASSWVNLIIVYTSQL